MSHLYTLVIAEDEQKIREGLVNLFPWESLGFSIVGDFSNGKEVLSFLKDHPNTDVVLTDIEMPMMDGIELSKILYGQNTYVVFFSSYQNFSYAKSAIENRVFDYLVKPIKYQDLVNCFEKLKIQMDKEKRHPTNASQNTLQASSDPIHVVLDYIDEHIQDASLEEAARRAFLSPSYLSVLFKESTGISFSDQLKKKRMEKACKLLCDLSVKQYQIAWIVGYDNPKNFTRAFKAYYGITPNDYRLKYSSAAEDSENKMTEL